MKGRWRWYAPVFACVVAWTAAPVRAQSPVEAFVQQNVDRGIAMLKDKSLDDAARRKQIGEFLANVLDTKKMAMFMLGAAREKAAASDLDAYAEVYQAFTIASYESQLNGYGGETLNVTGSVERASGDYVVNAVVVDPSGPNDPMQLPVAFRVEDEGGGKFAVVDASIAGIWLGLAQRADFGGYLNQHANSVPALLAHLQEVTAKLAPSTTAAR
jgi:phospholipid transport system substrate-binding protein